MPTLPLRLVPLCALCFIGSEEYRVEILAVFTTIPPVRCFAVIAVDRGWRLTVGVISFCPCDFRRNCEMHGFNTEESGKTPWIRPCYIPRIVKSIRLGLIAAAVTPPSPG